MVYFVTYSSHLRHVANNGNIIQLIQRRDIEVAYRRDQRKNALLAAVGMILTLGAMVALLLLLNKL